MQKLRPVILLALAIVSVGTLSFAGPGKPPKNADQIMSRYARNTRALRRFVCIMEVQVLGFGNSPSLKRVEKVRVAFDGPRRVAVRELQFAVSGPDGRDKEAFAYPRYYHEIIADGSHYYALDAYQKEYVLRGLQAKGVASDPLGAGIFSDFTFGNLLLSSASDKRAAPPSGGKIVGTQVLNNVVCDKVQFFETIEMPDGSKQKDENTYWISRKDGLLRRFETKSASAHIIESYSLQQVGGLISKSEFQIKPPSTAKQVDNL